MKARKTNTISLSLDFNDEKQYHFTVEIPRKVYGFETDELTGVNDFGDSVDLGGLGKVLMDLLQELSLATKHNVDRGGCVEELWEVRARSVARHMAALLGARVKEGEPSAQLSASAAGIATPDVSVSLEEFSPKAK